MNEYDNGWTDALEFRRDQRRESPGSISFSLGFASIMFTSMTLFAILLVASQNHWTIPNPRLHLWWGIVAEIVAIITSTLLFRRGARLNRVWRAKMKEKWGDRW